MERKWNKYVFMMLFGLLSGLVFCQELYDDIESVVVFKAGSGTGELGIMPNPDTSHLEGKAIGDDYFINGPSALCFDDEGCLYIIDQWNSRIMIYNADYTFERSIEIDELEPNIIFVPHQIKVNAEKIFFYQYDSLSTFTGEIDFDGTFLWRVRINVDKREERIIPYNYYYDEENGLFFQYLENGNISCYTDLQRNYRQYRHLTGKDEINAYFKVQGYDDEMYIDEENRLIKNDKLFKFDSLSLSNLDVRSQRYYIGSDIMGNIFYNFQKTRVTVWTKDKIFIKNMGYSEDRFRIDISYFPAIHPSGDIYFLEYKDGVEAPVLKRIRNTWDPVGRETWYALSDETRGILNDGGVRLRGGPATNTEILGTYGVQTGFRILEEGKREEEIGGERGVWYKVRLDNGKEGWFFGAYVEKL